MTVVRWEPLQGLSTLQTEMNRLFNTVTEPADAAMRRWVPAMDLLETNNDFVLRADLPGLSEDDVKIELEDNVLSISGERKSEHEERQEGYYRVERGFGAFSRALTLPKGIDAQGVKAHFENGVLEVRVPKPEEKKPHRISIGVNGKGAIEGSAQGKS